MLCSEMPRPRFRDPEMPRSRYWDSEMPRDRFRNSRNRAGCWSFGRNSGELRLFRSQAVSPEFETANSYFEISFARCKPRKRLIHRRCGAFRVLSMPRSGIPKCQGPDSGISKCRGPDTGIPKCRGPDSGIPKCPRPQFRNSEMPKAPVPKFRNPLCSDSGIPEYRIRNPGAGGRTVSECCGANSGISEIAYGVRVSGAIQLNCACFAHRPFHRNSKRPVPISKSVSRVANPGNA